MAKKIKFPLEMSAGIQVRTIEELREHFDLMKVLGYYVDGKLLTWLKDRYYENEAAQISELNSEIPDFYNKLCAVLGVEKPCDIEVDLEAVERRNERIAKLKQVVDDEGIISNVDFVAFNQEELADLLDEDISPIYLFGERFVVPLSKENVTYIGIGAVLPIVTINSKTPIDFAAKGIAFKETVFDGKYCQVVQVKENGRESERGTVAYKVSPLLDFMMNAQDRKSSEQLFAIIQNELSSFNYEVDKRSMPLLETLKKENLPAVFDEYLDKIS